MNSCLTSQTSSINKREAEKSGGKSREDSSRNSYVTQSHTTKSARCYFDGIADVVSVREKMHRGGGKPPGDSN